MTLRIIFLLISLFAALASVTLGVLALQAVDWDFATATRDFSVFLHSVFGQILLLGYFISGLSLTLFITYEAHARSDYYLYWALLPVLLFGIGTALPFYLYLRMPRRE